MIRELGQLIGDASQIAREQWKPYFTIPPSDPGPRR